MNYSIYNVERESNLCLFNFSTIKDLLTCLKEIKVKCNLDRGGPQFLIYKHESDCVQQEVLFLLILSASLFSEVRSGGMHTL